MSPGAVSCSSMLHSILRWAGPLLALLAVGPIAGWLTYSLRAPDGGPETTLLLSSSMSKGLAVGVGVVLLAILTGAAIARLVAPRSGLFSAGLVLVWGAWGLGRVDQVLARIPQKQTLYTISIEAAVVGLLAVVGAIVILRIRPMVELHAVAADHPAHADEPTKLVDSSTPAAFIAAAAAAALAGWLLAQDTLKGQTFAAAVVGGVFAAVAGRMASQRVSAAVFIAGIAALAVVSPTLATFMHPSSLGPANAARAGTLLALARPLPLDWLAGAFVGVPLGLAWAGSMIEKKRG